MGDFIALLSLLFVAAGFYFAQRKNIRVWMCEHGRHYWVVSQRIGSTSYDTPDHDLVYVCKFCGGHRGD